MLLWSADHRIHGLFPLLVAMLNVNKFPRRVYIRSSSCARDYDGVKLCKVQTIDTSVYGRRQE